MTAIPRFTLFFRLLMPVIAAAMLLLILVHQGVKPAAFGSAFNLDLIASIHPAVWVLVVTGLTGFLLGSWIWILQPKSPPAILFGLTGLATLAFAFSPLCDFFTTPMSVEFNNLMTRVNMFGASLYGVLMCVILLIYPSRLPFYKYQVAIIATVFLTWTIFASLKIERVGYAVQAMTFLQMLGIVIFALWQIYAGRNQPEKRAIAIWIGACVIIGSGPFIAMVATPLTFGFPTIIPSYYAVAFFNLVYIGFAVGLLRLRLFDLGSWAFQLLFHFGLFIAFILVDLILVSSLTVESGTALSLTVLMLAAIYLPIRGWLWGLVSGRNKVSDSEIFQSVLETGLKPSGEARAKSWIDLLNRTFKPIRMTHSHLRQKEVSLTPDGQSLFLPAAMDAPALVLHQKNEGRSLFSAKDQTLAAQLLSLIKQVDGSRQAYDRGVNEERSRIGRDIHDNIGAQLLQALHSNTPDRKDEMIRDSLSDLRDVINNSSSVQLSLSDMLANLRTETAERLEAKDIQFVWDADEFSDLNLPSKQLHAMRSVLREAVSNALKHANASQLMVQIKRVANSIEIDVTDNGDGIDLTTGRAADGLGQGLQNMRVRAEAQGGGLKIEKPDIGTRIIATFLLGGQRS